VVTEDKYTLNFFVPDNSCDGQIDDFSGKIIYTVRTEDNEEKAVEKKISFKSGRLIR